MYGLRQMHDLRFIGALNTAVTLNYFYVCNIFLDKPIQTISREIEIKYFLKTQNFIKESLRMVS